MTDDKHIRENMFNLLSLLSFDQTIKESLLDLGYDDAILGMVKRVVETKLAKGGTVFTKSPLQRALMNILLNLSAESREANYLMDGKPELNLKNGNPIFKKIIKIAIETLDIGLLKVVNNATYFCKPEHTKNIMKGAVAPIRDAVVRLVTEE